MSNLKKFVGEQAYNTIKNITVDADKIKLALVTPQNARNVFSNLTEFQVKSLCFEISNNQTMGQIRTTTQAEIIQAFNSVGYDKVIFDDEVMINECKKYYAEGERICTYNNLKSRMNEYHMLVAVKSNIDDIKRSKNPMRDDEYGTSILNIQIAKNGSHMSIKNRYNHTVGQCDSTLDNNLDLLCDGLQAMVLGHYNIASLSNKKAYYERIVNIGNVYLKYHCEKGNVYFGDFVLDNANGARFTDASRYCVTKTIARQWGSYPLILDFKDKKAIDVLSDRNNIKASILTRTIQENILTSENKADADTLSATFPNAKKELLQANKKAFQFIHDVYGYDFTKPYKVTAILGKFTAKTIEKATGSDTGILLIADDNKLKQVKMKVGVFCVNDLPLANSYSINNFYTKGDFETARKSGTTATYIIQQDKQYIGSPKQEKTQSYYYYRNKQAIEYDKSGCNITKTRYNLQCRLRQYKEEKKESEARQKDYTKEIEEITTLFTELKTKLIESLTNATSRKDYKMFSSAINCDFHWFVDDIEKFKQQALDKSFSSVEEAKRQYNHIKIKIAEISEKLNRNED